MIFKTLKSSNEKTKEILTHTFKSLFKVAKSTWPMMKGGLIVVMALAISFSPIEGLAKSKRTLKWPVPSVKGISSCFGDGRHHQAIDIYAKKGAKVVAVETGKVVKIVNKCTHNYAKSKYCCGDGYGKWVKVKHNKKINGKTVYSKYNHLTKITVKKGQKVKVGQKVGTVGATGYSAATHLDFQVMIKSKYVDPGKYLKLPKGLYYSGGRYKKCCADYIKKLKRSM